MRLLNVESRECKEFFDNNTPRYAIISHRWEGEEVSFKDYKKGLINNESGQIRTGMNKIWASCDMAQSRKLEWIWIDTCCIDKRSSAELSEAINSMYEWYKKAKECYVYLSDVLWADEDPMRRLAEESFRRSRWFTRGWTLQELLAPRHVIFFDRDWRRIGTRSGYHQLISSVTGIGVNYLLVNDREKVDSHDSQPPACERGKDCRFHNRSKEASIATKMSWASRRETSRVEDVAYCLLGIFDINMPLLYGEGHRAFQRLQHRLLEESVDDSILASREVGKHLAQSPADFAESRYINYWFPNIRSSLMPAVPLQATHVKGNLEIQLRWRNFDRKRRSLSVPLNCWQCTANDPRNVVLRISKVFISDHEDYAYSNTDLRFDLVQDFEEFFYPRGGSYLSWRPGNRAEEYHGELSEILGEAARMTRIYV
ncbi:MAG: hypothetical protein Q9222_007018 [Ikaeria aurantiellina]